MNSIILFPLRRVVREPLQVLHRSRLAVDDCISILGPHDNLISIRAVNVGRDPGASGQSWTTTAQ